MIEIIKHNNRIQIIVACLLIAAITTGAVLFDSSAWAQPLLPEEENTAVESSLEMSEEAEGNRIPLYKRDVPKPTEYDGADGKGLQVQSLGENSEPLPEGEADGYITVGLKYSSSAVNEINISCADGFYLAKKVGRGYVPDMDFRQYTDFVVKTEDATVNLYDVDGNLILTGLCTDDVLISAAEEADSRIISIGSEEYRDGVMFKVKNDTNMNVINFIGLEHYLWGCIHNEMSCGNPLEALKAQTVACRSYAVAHYGYHGKDGFDLCSSTDCQCYKGVSSERELTTEACLQTEGLVMYCDGKLASGFYFASSGGYTMNSEDVWGGTVSYLRGVQDIYAPLVVWNTSISFDDLSARLSSKGYNVGNIQNVEITDHFANGAVKTMVITGDAGTAVLSGKSNPSSSSIVSVLGSKTLQSIFFSMSEEIYPGVAVETTTNVVTTEVPVTTSEAAVIDGDGSITTVNLTASYATDGDSVQPVNSSASSTAVYTQVPVAGGVVYFSGSGYGHGVGMPQTSAVAMAKAGHDYQEILYYYYTGIELKQFTSD